VQLYGLQDSDDDTARVVLARRRNLRAQAVLLCLGSLVACAMVATAQTPTPTPPSNDPALLDAVNYVVVGIWFLCGLVFVGMGLSRVRV